MSIQQEISRLESEIVRIKAESQRLEFKYLQDELIAMGILDDTPYGVNDHQDCKAQSADNQIDELHRRTRELIANITAQIECLKTCLK